MANEKKVIIDLRGGLLTLERRGIKKSVTEVSENHGITSTTFQNWDKEAPKAVKFIWDFCNETGLTFEELVKEV